MTQIIDWTQVAPGDLDPTRDERLRHGGTAEAVCYATDTDDGEDIRCTRAPGHPDGHPDRHVEAVGGRVLMVWDD